MIVGTSDMLVSFKDSKRAYDEMTNSVGKTFTSYDIGHLSFILGKDMPHLPKIFEILE